MGGGVFSLHDHGNRMNISVLVLHPLARIPHHPSWKRVFRSSSNTTQLTRKIPIRSRSQLPTLEARGLYVNMGSNIRLNVFTIGLFIAIILNFSRLSHQLECYVCQNQDDNKNKCAETVKICDLEQDKCLTEVRWGSTPNWSLTSRKQYFVSKRCATKLECQEPDKANKCDRIWYNDWNCTTCCSGDKCNYYITLASSTVKPFHPTLILVGCIIAIVSHYLKFNPQM